MMLMSNSASSVVASPSTVSHDATFVCPSPASSFTPYIIPSNSPSLSLTSTPSSSTLSLCSYPTLKQECQQGAGSSSSTVRIASWPPVDSIFPIGPAPHFIPAALVRLANKASHDDNLPYAVLQLNKRESTIGRDQCDISIGEVEISRKHALIKYEHNHWWIVDLKSTNGIFIHGARVKPETQILLRDGSIISFGPESTCNFKYVFREGFGVISKHLSHKFPNALVLPPPTSQMVDQSGYETATSGQPTQEMLPPHPPPPQQQQVQHQLHYQSVSGDLLYQLDYTRAEVGRLRSDRTKLEAQLAQQKDIVCKMGHDFEYNKLKLAEKEKRTTEKSQNLDTLIAKYRTLCGQLEETQKVASQSRSQSDVEIIFPTGAAGGGLSQSTMSSVLKEMTCSICTEYLIAPTSLNCSHVFCGHCIDKWCHEYRAKYNSISNGICPVCRKEVQCQAPVLVLENIINMLLDSVLDDKEKQDRAVEIEKRRQKALAQNPCGLPINASGGTSSPNSLGSFIQQILAGFPLRSRRQSIVITSDDSDDDDDVHVDDDDEVVNLEELQEGARRIRRLSDQDVIALDDRPPTNAGGSSPEVIGLHDEEEEHHGAVHALASDEEIEEEYDFSFTLSEDRAGPADGGRRRQRRRHSSNLAASMPRIALGLSLDSGEDSNDDEVEEIFMLGDDSDLDDSSNDSFLSQGSSGSEELFLFDLDDHHDDQQQQRSSSRNSPIEPIVISDSEESQLQAILPAGQQQQQQVRPVARRSSMIILSDSEDSLLPVLSTAAAVTSGPSTSNCRRSSRSRQNGLSTSEIVEISSDQAAPGGGNGRRRGSSDSGNSHPNKHRAHHQHSRAHRQNRAHQPYSSRRNGHGGGRTSQNQSLSSASAAAAPRRATLCA